MPKVAVGLRCLGSELMRRATGHVGSQSPVSVGRVVVLLLSFGVAVLVGCSSDVTAQPASSPTSVFTPAATPATSTGPPGPAAVTSVSPAAPSPLPPSTTLPAATSAPTRATPNLCGAPSNPWSYNFCGGTVISSPPSNFCSYFNCIASFAAGRGYVIQCADRTFSKSGGISGSCSGHGGNARALNAP